MRRANSTSQADSRLCSRLAPQAPTAVQGSAVSTTGHPVRAPRLKRIQKLNEEEISEEQGGLHGSDKHCLGPKGQPGCGCMNGGWGRAQAESAHQRVPGDAPGQRGESVKWNGGERASRPRSRDETRDVGSKAPLHKKGLVWEVRRGQPPGSVEHPPPRLLFSPFSSFLGYGPGGQAYHRRQTFKTP